MSLKNLISRTLLVSIGVATTAIVAGIGVFLWLSPLSPFATPGNNANLERPAVERSFNGSSAKLKHTVVVPTLDSPAPSGKNVIWCSSFPLAWERLKEDVNGSPIELLDGEDASDRLNRASGYGKGLLSEHYYAAAGVGQPAIERIQREMAERFPEVGKPEFDSDSRSVAYSYLKTNVTFEFPYFDCRWPIKFRPSKGAEQDVAFFGIRHDEAYAYGRLRGQVSVLHYTERMDKNGRETPDEFVIDPCDTSNPYQLLLCRVNYRNSLAETLAYAQAQIEANTVPSHYRGIGTNDTLLMPNLHFRIDHHFKELEGKIIKTGNANGQWIDEASQLIEFKLDRSGAELAAESKIVCKPAPRDFLFDQPFLIVVRNRENKVPIFVMWVDNAELLCPFKSE